MEKIAMMVALLMLVGCESPTTEEVLHQEVFNCRKAGFESAHVDMFEYKKEGWKGVYYAYSVTCLELREKGEGR